MLKSLFNIFKRSKTVETVKETKVKTEFPEYPFYHQDFELANKIKGLTKIGHVDQKPFGPYFYYKVDNSICEQDFNDFLDSLPKEFGFEFRKRLDPTKGISDTAVIVQKKGDNYFSYHFSHGQSKIWHLATRDEIFNSLIANKGFQYNQSFRTYRAMKKPVEGASAI